MSHDNRSKKLYRSEDVLNEELHKVVRAFGYGGQDPLRDQIIPKKRIVLISFV